MSSAEATGQVTCGSCNKTIRYPASKAGLSGKCPGCGNKITLPALKKPVSAPVAEEAKPIPTPVAIVSPPPAPQPPAIIQTKVVAQAQLPIEVQPKPVDSELSRFMADGQSAAMITKLLDRVKQICTSTEDILYMAVQQKPAVNLSPDAIVLTSKRAIIFRQKLRFDSCTQ
jgi:predicted RNA-binding Zn-ribbon protein involved in translation (DUF1610 family)